MANPNNLPLTSSQQRLRGRPVEEMSLEQLHDWARACSAMEAWPRMDGKGRRTWKEARIEVQAELARRSSGPDSESEDETAAPEADEEAPAKLSAMRSSIMYIEKKSPGSKGAARIGRVHFSKTGKTLYYQDLRFHGAKDPGSQSNYLELDSGDAYLIAALRDDQNNQLFSGHSGVEVDEDVSAEYRSLLSKRAESK